MPPYVPLSPFKIMNNSKLRIQLKILLFELFYFKYMFKYWVVTYIRSCFYHLKRIYLRNVLFIISITLVQHSCHFITFQWIVLFSVYIILKEEEQMKIRRCKFWTIMRVRQNIQHKKSGPKLEVGPKVEVAILKGKPGFKS